MAENIQKNQNQNQNQKIKKFLPPRCTRLLIIDENAPEPATTPSPNPTPMPKTEPTPQLDPSATNFQPKGRIVKIEGYPLLQIDLKARNVSL
jgi:hypothetical protein